MRMSGAVLFVLIAAMAALAGCATLKAERNAPPIGEFVDIDGERLHFIDLAPAGAAKGPPIVLIHGASVNLRDMKIALGDALSKDRRVIAIDRPGRGYSTRPKDGWRLDVQSRLIHDAVASLGAEKPVIVGQSFGGSVALSYALQYQDQMSGLVLLAPVSHEWPGGVAWYNRVSGWPLAGFLFRRLVIPLYAPIAAKGGVTRSFGPDEAPAEYFEASGLPLLFRPRDFRSNAADIRKLKPQIVEMSTRYGDIRIPTAILAGETDTTVSPKLHAIRLAGEIAGASIELLPDTGHALHHSQTARVIAAIERIADEGR